MAFRIHFESSDKLVSVENNETILDVAIRSGIAVSYGCSNGSCGECIAKCLDGCVESIRNSDYVFDRSLKDGKHFLMCSSTACSDLRIDAFLNKSETNPPQKLNTQIKSIDCDTNNIIQMRVRVPRSKRLRFNAGQFAVLRHIEWGQGEYPIASCPCDAQELEFYFYDHDDPFVSALSKNAKKKEVLEVEAPFGNFTFSEDMQRPVILFSYGIGFAVIKSLTEHILSQESQLPVTLYTSAKTHEHFVKLCRMWSDGLDQMTHFELDEDIDALLKDFSNRIDENIAVTTDFYLSAPQEINSKLVEMLKAKNVAQENIRRQDILADGSIDR